VRLDLLLLLLFLLLRGRGRGVEVGFFFSLHLKCGRRRGKGVFFLLNFFFIVEWLRKGKVFFFYKFIMGEGLVESGYFQNTTHSWV